MLPVPPGLLSRYGETLSRNAIPVYQQPHYCKWLRFYLDFCSKYAHPPLERESVRGFLRKLVEKSVAEWMRHQATDAVRLYFLKGEARPGRRRRLGAAPIRPCETMLGLGWAAPAGRAGIVGELFLAFLRSAEWLQPPTLGPPAQRTPDNTQRGSMSAWRRPRRRCPRAPLGRHRRNPAPAPYPPRLPRVGPSSINALRPRSKSAITPPRP